MPLVTPVLHRCTAVDCLLVCAVSDETAGDDEEEDEVEEVSGTAVGRARSWAACCPRSVVE